jgi:hypothetical protein
MRTWEVARLVSCPEVQSEEVNFCWGKFESFLAVESLEVVVEMGLACMRKKE